MKSVIFTYTIRSKLLVRTSVTSSKLQIYGKRGKPHPVWKSTNMLWVVL